MSKKIKDSLEKLETALERINEALAEDSSDTLVIDGFIRGKYPQDKEENRVESEE